MDTQIECFGARKLVAMMKRPQVSVLMPAYQAEPYIGEAIESVLNQSLSNFELLISEDFSTDRTYEICQRYCQQDNRVRLLPRAGHVGLFRNFNLCLKSAQGTYIKFLCDDDVLTPSALEQMIAPLEHNPAVNVVSCAKRFISADGRLDHVSAPYAADTFMPGRQAVRENLSRLCNDIGSPTCVMIRNRESPVYFDSAYVCYGDVECWFRHLLPGDYYFLAEPFCNVRLHGDQTTNATIDSFTILSDMVRLGRQYEEFMLEEGFTSSQWQQMIADRVASYGKYITEQLQVTPGRMNAAIDKVWVAAGGSTEALEILFRDMAACVACLAEEASRLQESNSLLQNQGKTREAEVMALRSELDASRSELHSLRSELQSLRSELHSITATLTWRISYPLRRLRSMMLSRKT